MARTPSKMIDLGSKLPDFNLINTINNQFFDHKKLNNEIGTLVMFISVSYTHLPSPRDTPQSRMPSSA